MSANALSVKIAKEFLSKSNRLHGSGTYCACDSCADNFALLFNKMVEESVKSLEAEVTELKLVIDLLKCVKVEDLVEVQTTVGLNPVLTVADISTQRLSEIGDNSPMTEMERKILLPE